MKNLTNEKMLLLPCVLLIVEEKKEIMNARRVYVIGGFLFLTQNCDP